MKIYKILLLLISFSSCFGAILTVTNLNDDGAGSLRQALSDVSAGDTIVFDDSLTGSIPLSVTLPDIGLDNITIRGNLDVNGIPKVAVDGSALTNDSWGFKVSGFISSAFFTLENMAIIGCNNGTEPSPNNIGVLIQYPSNNATIANCFIGTADGVASSANGDGVNASGVDGLMISNSLISGNDFNGIFINGGVTNSTIANNRIGVSADGESALANGESGIHLEELIVLESCDSNSIQENVISGNTISGITLLANAGNIISTTINNNKIGTNSAGTTAIANGGYGVGLIGRGGATSGTIISGNIISGNNSNAILINNSVNNSVIKSNKMGVGIDGFTSIPNNGFCIEILENLASNPSSNNMIGGILDGDGNIIGDSHGGIYSINNGFSANILNSFLGNSIYSNVETPGISLGEGENNNQQPPTLVDVVLSSGNLILSINGMSPAVGSGADVPLRLEFFITDPSLSASNPQGKKFIGAIASVAPSSAFSASFTLDEAIDTSWFVTATATALNGTGETPGDTSQFTGAVNPTRSVAPAGFNGRLIQKYGNRVR